LAGVPLGLKSFHIFELKDEIDADIYDEQISMMEMVLDMDALVEAVLALR
jgi:hypothetical protein